MQYKCLEVITTEYHSTHYGFRNLESTIIWALCLFMVLSNIRHHIDILKLSSDVRLELPDSLSDLHLISS